MREILFRGKRIDNGEWVEGDLFHNDDERFPMTMIGHVICSRNKHNGEIDFDGYYLLEVDISSVGQYTGLTDKNGRRIFEGDILKEDYRFGGKHILHAVEFGESSFGTKRFVSGKLSDFCVPFDDCENPLYAEGETEVIGNIHDNPELLEV